MAKETRELLHKSTGDTAKISCRWVESLALDVPLHFCDNTLLARILGRGARQDRQQIPGT